MGRKKYDYEATVKLRHNEIAAKINLDTAELTEVKHHKTTIPNGKQLWNPKEPFTKHYVMGNKIIDWLETILTDQEMKVLWKMTRMVKFETNSLEPLNGDYGINQIAKEFNISRNRVSPIFKKLYNLGVYANFDVKKVNVPYTKYWILNPYICFSGRLIDNDIAKLFEGTMIEMKFKSMI